MDGFALCFCGVCECDVFQYANMTALTDLLLALPAFLSISMTMI